MITRRRFLEATAGGVAAAALAAHTTTDSTTTLRARFAALEHCDPGCPGWGIFHVDRDSGIEIEVCDECVHGTDLIDDDAALLPEAQAALREEITHPILEDIWQ